MRPKIEQKTLKTRKQGNAQNIQAISKSLFVSGEHFSWLLIFNLTKAKFYRILKCCLESIWNVCRFSEWNYLITLLEVRNLCNDCLGFSRYFYGLFLCGEMR